MKATLQQELNQLQENNPTAYAVLKKHIHAIKNGIDHSPDNYPPSQKLLEYADAEDDYYPQHLGRSLAILNDLGVISIYRKRSNSIRYDLTSTDTEKLDLLH